MPAGVVTVTSTVPLPAGLAQVIKESLSTTTLVAASPPKSTAVAPVKPLPSIRHVGATGQRTAAGVMALTARGPT